MNLRLVLLALITLVVSCKKNQHDEIVNKTPAELLTQKSWKIVNMGFDANQNDVLDPNEGVVADCVKDNTYQFFANGSGIYKDNAVSCGFDSEGPLPWTLS